MSLRHVPAWVLAAALLCSCAGRTDAEQPAADPVTVRTRTFSLSLPRDFEITSFSGPDSELPAHVTAVKGGSLLTVSAARYSRGLEESCRLAAGSFVSDASELTAGPRIRDGVCEIRAGSAGNAAVLLMLKDEEAGVLYAVARRGDLGLTGTVAATLRGSAALAFLGRLP